MGYLVEKYNKAYFLRQDEAGNPVSYGVEGIEAFHKGELRDHDRAILARINFAGTNVLEFGFGRGETAKYVCEHAAKRYTGVDFSQDACVIATDFLSRFAITEHRIVCADALDYVRNLTTEGQADIDWPINIVLMLDFVEHVPRSELREILQALLPLLDTTAVVVVNTPDFALDNDVVAEGLNESALDSSDLVSETRGMHCNRYTLSSLRTFFSDLGYLPISRGHYFALPVAPTGPWAAKWSYRKVWNEARARGLPLIGDWQPEAFEIAYSAGEQATLHRFAEGNLSGIAIYLVPSYLEYYSQGNCDDFLLEYAGQYDLTGKVVYDLGAFVGVNSMQFARLVGRSGMVYGFEPSPLNVDRALLNISENPELADRIRIFSLAISDAAGKARFRVHRNIDDGVSSASHLSGAHTTLAEEQIKSLGFTDVDVTTATLDEVVEHTGVPPACIKIDIEGSEHLALAGASVTLQRYRPLLLIEIHSIYCAIASLDTLALYGYGVQLLHIEPDGRCFIGASASAPQPGGAAEIHRVLPERTFFAQKIFQLHAAMDSLKRQHAELAALTALHRVQLKEANASRTALESKLQAANGELANATALLDEARGQRTEFACELERQCEVNAQLSAHLLRYQMFPPIRFARKVRRLFS